MQFEYHEFAIKVKWNIRERSITYGGLTMCQAPSDKKKFIIFMLFVFLAHISGPYDNCYTLDEENELVRV